MDSTPAIPAIGSTSGPSSTPRFAVRRLRASARSSTSRAPRVGAERGAHASRTTGLFARARRPCRLRDALGDAVQRRVPGAARVRYWQVWNEPNLSIELDAADRGREARLAELVSGHGQRHGARACTPYTATTSSSRAASRRSVATATTRRAARSRDQERIHPLEFMREMLCMSDGAKPEPTCDRQSEFDVWAHHPYTYGGPTHHAFNPDDVSIGDLGDDATASSRQPKRPGTSGLAADVGFWVTEFSYDSNPRDPKGLPPALHARWTSEALYRMWQQRSQPRDLVPASRRAVPERDVPVGPLLPRPNGSRATSRSRRCGHSGSRSSPSARRAARSRTGAARRRASEKAVVVEQQAGVALAAARAPKVDRYGIFQGRVPSARGGPLRARLVDRERRRVPFSLDRPADFRFCPWGSFC